MEISDDSRCNGGTVGPIGFVAGLGDGYFVVPDDEVGSFGVFADRVRSEVFSEYDGCDMALGDVQGSFSPASVWVRGWVSPTLDPGRA